MITVRVTGVKCLDFVFCLCVLLSRMFCPMLLLLCAAVLMPMLLLFHMVSPHFTCTYIAQITDTPSLTQIPKGTVMEISEGRTEEFRR